MESPERKKQKVLKAKKTMPASCRKQLEILNMSKNVEASKSTVGTNIPNGHNQKKMFSENKENVKLMKTSEQINENGCVALERHTALLEQVKHWIRQEIYMINCNLFDKKLNELNERIGKTQCKNKHEAIAEFGKNRSKKFSNSSNTIIEVGAKEKKPDFVIDLTRDGLSSNSIESPAFTLKSSSKAVLRSNEIIPVAENGDEGFDSFEHLPPLPEPSPPLSEMADKIQDTLPPQKPELRVKRVLRPPGIALAWNISKVNPKCAPVESYHLFLCYENSNHLTWRKIAEIQALPLPMACTVSQFLASSRYYFTLQSKDIFGRYGPFCNIKSIPGFSENLT
ncbi:hypothetical protein U0070_008589 [Myodes glareolus]|uniref:Activating transcription factor 7-interacting protein Fn3 domain-containing protein n=1 Tax=Myodes glareolus TaxID=447135 RepID=A0AAW0JGR9_MYOGA